VIKINVQHLIFPLFHCLIPKKEKSDPRNNNNTISRSLDYFPIFLVPSKIRHTIVMWEESNLNKVGQYLNEWFEEKGKVKDLVTRCSKFLITFHESTNSDHNIVTCTFFPLFTLLETEFSSKSPFQLFLCVFKNES